MRLQALLLAVGVAVFLTACSSGPTTPEAGSPAFLWNAARQAYRNGDLLKANDRLSELQQSDNEFSPRARIWQIVLAGGIARGYSELADGYESGARINRDNTLVFHKQMIDLRSMAGHVAMDFTQAVHAFVDRDPSADVQLAFDLPPGSAIQPLALRKAYGGILMQDAEAESLETAMVELGVIRAMCRANGTEGDSAQVLEKFKAGEVTTPRATFVYAAVKMLFEVSDIFAANKLDEPQHSKVMWEQALAALHSIPETKETTALATKIQAALKKIPNT
ncbi:MAG: hypothetical protein ABSE42_18630 [Bryobacteraceae bacterium]|jgi:hypothetical protein